jgi:hypothetical protein
MDPSKIWMGKFQENGSGSNVWENSHFKDTNLKEIELQPQSK